MPSRWMAGYATCSCPADPLSAPPDDPSPGRDLHRWRSRPAARRAPHRTALPPALAALLTELASTAVTTSAVGRSVPGPRWLFPGPLPGQHFTPGRLAAKLNRHGIRIRRSRNSALAALAADIPAAALSPLLGIGIETAVRWHTGPSATGRLTSRPERLRRSPSTATPTRTWRPSRSVTLGQVVVDTRSHLVTSRPPNRRSPRIRDHPSGYRASVDSTSYTDVGV